MAQRLSPGYMVTVIVVDDGSPVPADSEVVGLRVPEQIVLTVIKQGNGGVGHARNTGLASVDESFHYIAFLDSDDTWHEDHLSQGVAALERGNDFYFCDHSREGHHHSLFDGCTSPEGITLKASQADSALINLTPIEAMTLILKEFLSQASTSIYRRDIAPTLRFNDRLTHAGEDMLFFMGLASRARRVCVSRIQMVHCGTGINIYYSNLNWNAAGFLKRLVDMRQSHKEIQQSFKLSREAAAWNTSLVKQLQRDIAFHSLRQFVRARGHWPDAFHSLAKQETDFIQWFAIAVLQVLIGIPLRRYKPH